MYCIRKFELNCSRCSEITAELSTADADKVHFAIILEPDSLPNIVTNLSVPKCAGAAEAYRTGIAYVSHILFPFCEESLAEFVLILGDLEVGDQVEYRFVH